MMRPKTLIKWKQLAEGSFGKGAQGIWREGKGGVLGRGEEGWYCYRSTVWVKSAEGPTLRR